jgi:GNAT superfamily N-acetyltransferase
MSAITIRQAIPTDAPTCSKIVFAAFAGIQDRHNFPRDFPTVEAASGLTDAWINHPKVYAIVAEQDGRIVGFNGLDQRDAIGAPGPVVVDPAAQAKGVGRRMMEAVIERAVGMRGMRLLQEAFNTSSMSLYASQGFEVKEPIVLMLGKVKDASVPEGFRLTTIEDLSACAALCEKVHGLNRTSELADALSMLGSVVLERAGRIIAYASSPNFYLLSHAVAETTEDLQDLIRGMAAPKGETSIMIPIRNAPLFRWCLAQGMRVIKPLNLMARGEYQEPAGAFCPSIEY